MYNTDKLVLTVPPPLTHFGLHSMTAPGCRRGTFAAVVGAGAAEGLRVHARPPQGLEIY
jgi:hypothetical protein